MPSKRVAFRHPGSSDVFNINYVGQGSGSFYAETVDFSMQYLGEQYITGSNSNQFAALPYGTRSVGIRSEGGASYASINGTGTSNSGVYIPQDWPVIIGPYWNLTALGLYVVAGAKTHLIFEG